MVITILINSAQPVYSLTALSDIDQKVQDTLVINDEMPIIVTLAPNNTVLMGAVSLLPSFPTIQDTVFSPAKRCFLDENGPKNGLEQVSCNAVKQVTEVGLTVGLSIGICYFADTIATVLFPPAAALAPVCNGLGATLSLGPLKKLVTN